MEMSDFTWQRQERNLGSSYLRITRKTDQSSNNTLRTLYKT